MSHQFLHPILPHLFLRYCFTASFAVLFISLPSFAVITSPAQLSARSNDEDRLASFFEDIFNNRNSHPSGEEGQSQYPIPPTSGSFGNQFYDEYTIDPSERPIPLYPALPLSPEEQKLQERYRKKQRRLQEREERKKKKQFNNEFRLGLGVSTFLGFPNFLNIGNRITANSVPPSYIFNPMIADASPLITITPIFNNYFAFNTIIHLFPFLELTMGIGTQTDVFLHLLSTIGDQKNYLDGLIRRRAFYAIKYQKDTVFFELGAAVLLPWVLNGRSKTVLGLRISATLGLGAVTQQSLSLVKPSLPSSVTIFNTNPTPKYEAIQTFPLHLPASSAINSTRWTLSGGGFFELQGFRLYVGYSIRFFPAILYHTKKLYILQEFTSGSPLQYSSIELPKDITMVHSINVNLSYLINPLQILKPRSKAQKRYRYQKSQRKTVTGGIG